MSYYCRGKFQRRIECIVEECPKMHECERYKAFKDYCMASLADPNTEGFGCGVWYVDCLDCVRNGFSDGVFLTK